MRLGVMALAAAAALAGAVWNSGSGARAAAIDDSTETTPGGDICGWLERSASDNEISPGYFIRLIWQESHFNPYSVSRAGAQGIAQFMPATARSRGLADPFNPEQAIAKSAELLRELVDEFGNFGLAAAAYNAGPKRVIDWLTGSRGLPVETRAYVRIITGHAVEDWTKAEPDQPKIIDEFPPCTELETVALRTSQRRVVTSRASVLRHGLVARAVALVHSVSENVLHAFHSKRPNIKTRDERPRAQRLRVRRPP